MQGALEGIRVVDLAQGISGSYCTKLLAGFGADVVKVEPPGGDALRRLGPFVRAADGSEHGVPFLWLNTGKRSVTLDLESPKGVAIFERLVGNAAVAVVEAPAQGGLAPVVRYEALQKLAPSLIVLTISDFGAGPYRDYQAEEIQLQAISGMMHMTGAADKPPLATGPAVCRYSAGLNAYTATLMALLQRGAGESAPAGQHIELAVMESSVENVENAVTNYLHRGAIGRRGGHMFAPWGLYEGADGYVAVVGAPFRNWNKGAEMFEEPRLQDPKFAHVTGRVKHHDELDGLMAPWLGRREVREIFRAGQERNLAFGYVAPLEEALESPQHESREFFTQLDHPAVGPHRICGAPYRMSKTPWRTLRAPLLGEHTGAVLGGELGYASNELEALGAEGIL